jgi:hypothetical protein
MSKAPLTPQQKKALSYKRDHYTRGGESTDAWRKAKPLKKRKAVRSQRRNQDTALKKRVDAEADAETSAVRRLTSVRQKEVEDWGVMSLAEYVKNRQDRRARFSKKAKS